MVSTMTTSEVRKTPLSDDKTTTITRRATANCDDIEEQESIRESSNPLILVLRCLNALLHIPMYMMLICIVVFFVLLYISPVWLKTLLIIYQFGYGTIRSDSTLSPILPENWRKFCRSEFTVRWTAQYFRMNLVKTTDLNPNQSYLFVYHPHGVISIISMGYATALCTNGCNFESKFPGIDRFGTTLKATFLVPFYREWLQSIGFIVASRKNIVEKLKSKKSIMLVPGGATEALHAHPGCFDLYLNNRKGFVKVAMETGSSIVPCLGFGENEIFQTYKPIDPLDTDSAHSSASDPMRRSLHSVQKRLQKTMTFSLPILTDFIPRRQKVTVVVGKPIRFRETDGSDRAVVEKNHKLYVESLRQLYDKTKVKYGQEGVELRIL